MKQKRSAERVEAFEVRQKAKDAGLPDPWGKFMGQIKNAERRGIAWNLTFREWWSLWEPHYGDRGTRKTQKVMCRTLDRGAYEVGNVRIDYASANGHEKKMSNYARYGSKWRRDVRNGHAHLAPWHQRDEFWDHEHQESSYS